MPKNKHTNHDLTWAVKLAARYLFTLRGEEETQSLIDILRGSKPSPFKSNAILAMELEAVLNEQRRARAVREAQNTLMRAESNRPDPIATCIGCGCDDLHACVVEASPGDVIATHLVDGILTEALQPCHWLRVERGAGLGVCSACPGSVERWDAGDRGAAND